MSLRWRGAPKKPEKINEVKNRMNTLFSCEVYNKNKNLATPKRLSKDRNSFIMKQLWNISQWLFEPAPSIVVMRSPRWLLGGFWTLPFQLLITPARWPARPPHMRLSSSGDAVPGSTRGASLLERGNCFYPLYASGPGTEAAITRRPVEDSCHWSKVGIRNLSPQLRNIADNQIDCGVAD